MNNNYEIRLQRLTEKLEFQQILLDDRKAIIELLEESSRERMIRHYREKANDLEAREKQLHKIITDRDIEIINQKMTIEMLKEQIGKGGRLSEKN